MPSPFAHNPVKYLYDHDARVYAALCLCMCFFHLGENQIGVEIYVIIRLMFKNRISWVFSQVNNIGEKYL